MRSLYILGRQWLIFLLTIGVVVGWGSSAFAGRRWRPATASPPISAATAPAQPVEPAAKLSSPIPHPQTNHKAPATAETVDPKLAEIARLRDQLGPAFQLPSIGTNDRPGQASFLEALKSVAAQRVTRSKESSFRFAGVEK